MKQLRMISGLVFLVAALSVSVACDGEDPTPTATAPQPTPTAQPTAMPSEPAPTEAATPTPGVSTRPDPTPTRPAPAATATPTPVPDPSFDAEDHFSGETVRIVIPFGAGGGTDIQARFFAAHLDDYIPGRPRIVVTNTPPQDASLNRLYDHTNPDGFTMLMTSGNRTQAQFESDAITFEFDKFRFINTFGSPAGISFVGNGYKYNRLQDAIGKDDDLLVGMVDGPTQSNAMLWAATSEFLDVPLKLIIGSGTGTAFLYSAFDREEINLIPRFGGILWYTVPTQRPGYIAEGTFQPFCLCMPRGAQVSGNAESDLPADVLNPIELMEQRGVSSEEIADFELLTEVTSRFAKMLVLPPDTPQPIVDTLRTAFDNLLSEPTLNADFAKLQGQPVRITPGAEIEEILSRTVPRYGEIRGQFQKYVDLAEDRLN